MTLAFIESAIAAADKEIDKADKALRDAIVAGDWKATTEALRHMRYAQEHLYKARMLGQLDAAG